MLRVETGKAFVLDDLFKGGDLRLEGVFLGRAFLDLRAGRDGDQRISQRHARNLQPGVSPKIGALLPDHPTSSTYTDSRLDSQRRQ